MPYCYVYVQLQEGIAKPFRRKKEQTLIPKKWSKEHLYFDPWNNFNPDFAKYIKQKV